jgi:tetratricopeptide (TPR) repeat protein
MSKRAADWVREIVPQIIEKKFDTALLDIETALNEHHDDAQLVGYRGVIEILTCARSKGIESLKFVIQAFQVLIANESDEDFKRIYRDQLGNIGNHLFSIADGSVAGTAPLQLSKMLIEEVGWRHRRAVKTVAVDAINDGQAQVAIDLLKPLLETDPKYDSGWYNLACAYAQLGMKSLMLEAAQKAIQTSLSEAVFDVRPDLIEDEDFSAYRNDPDFIDLVSPLPKDPSLRPTYTALQDGHLDKVLSVGEAALPQATDQLAILEAMLEAAKQIASDIDEHGEEFSQYMFKQPKYSEMIQHLKAQISELKSKGAKSSIFRNFKESL